MKLEPVEFRTIQAVGYDETTSTLEILLNSDQTYRYFEVPKTVCLELMESDSKNSYIRSEIIHCYLRTS
ncbi:KTSC domain-containing protein [Microcoleus sp. S28C3]|uniref:KTSC domain-containing protein n=1 Tax=Microcoleus sp. S28C3 TaxID=3055414 RepID=UPI002FD36FF5